MNPFKSLTNDLVYIEDSENQRSSEYKAVLSKDGTNNIATVFDKDLVADEGDKLIQSLPNGKEKVFTIIDVDYTPKISSIPAHYKLTIEKASSLKKETVLANQTTINLGDSNTVQIGDNNVQNITNSITELMQQIDSSSTSIKEKEEAKSIIKQLISNPVVKQILGKATSKILDLFKNDE